MLREMGSKKNQTRAALTRFINRFVSVLAAAMEISVEPLRGSPAAISRESRGQRGRRWRGRTGYIWGGRSGSGRRGKRGGIDGDRFQ
jgi:hypothetical protein